MFAFFMIAFFALLTPQVLQAQSVNYPMVRIEGGTFTMGAPAREIRQLGDVTVSGLEQPQRQVTISTFYMGTHEVTQGLWESVMGNNPSRGNLGVNFPVETVTWFMAVEFANRLSVREGLTPVYTISLNVSAGETNVAWNRNANGYRLPTEAEWEFAARAGTTTPWNTGDDIITSQANFNESHDARTADGTKPVGSFSANAWGLYDMHGNVWEWVWDWLGEYPSTPETDPAGASKAYNRVARGGGWYRSVRSLRSAARNGTPPHYWSIAGGFRLARNVPGVVYTPAVVE